MSNTVGSGNSLTFTEWHAAVLGSVVGAFAAYLRTIGYTAVGVSLAVFFVAGALGLRAYDGSVAGRTVTKEPWYALAALVVAGAAVMLIAG
ncbi:hypothetical protein [Halobacterium zhouii]|uniref:hypothetical protein n=1 Tax=Halobacterium zhouii TaxID=2902624 RepID=UPI001E57C397|nr:hypothetical protein [Halobacterium zhouii]